MNMAPTGNGRTQMIGISLGKGQPLVTFGSARRKLLEGILQTPERKMFPTLRT